MRENYIVYYGKVDEYMFKTKANKMREIVERQLQSVESQLNNLGDDTDSIVYKTLIAQKIAVKDILRDFERIEA